MSDYSSNFPQQRPSLNLDFANSGKLDSRISYSRSSTATAFSSERHLSSENFLKYSNDLSNADWNKARVTVGSTDNTAPDGSSTASSVLETAVTDTHTFYDHYTSVAGVSYTHTVFAKANGRTAFTLYTRDANATFDLTAVTATTTGMDAVSITAIGSTGWFKCVATEAATNTLGLVQIELMDGSATNYAGDVTKGMYFWGMQASSTGETVLNQTSGSIHREFAPTLKTAAANEPRFEYAADGQSVAKGLLIESQKSNLALNSNDFTNATWNKQRVTVTPSASIGPDGQLSASLIAENTDTTTIHFMLPTAAITSGYSVGTDKSTHSVFAKYAGRNLRMTDGYNPADGGSTIFDLQNGTVVSGGGSIQSCGNGWYRCSVTMTMSASTLLLPYIQLVDGTTWPNASDAGDGYSGVLLFGCQTEQQSMSSYITTGSSAVTKSADSCSLVSAPLLDNGSGGLTVEYDMRNASSTSYVLQTARSTGATNNDGVTIFNEGLFVNGAGSNTRIGNTTSNVFHKVAASWESGSQKISRDGSAVTEDTTTVVPQSGTDKLHIGTRQDGNTSINGHIRNIAIYSEPLTPTNLTTLSQL